MSPAFVLLLLSTTVVESLEVQTEEEEGFIPQLKHDERARVAHRTEEAGALPGFCCACQSIVAKVKQKLGSDHSKEKIGQLLNNTCNQMKNKLIKSACKKIIGSLKNKLIDRIAKDGSPRSICVKLKLCKRNVSSSSKRYASD